jgi:hypothetical protein
LDGVFIFATDKQPRNLFSIVLPIFSIPKDSPGVTRVIDIFRSVFKFQRIKLVLLLFSKQLHLQFLLNSIVKADDFVFADGVVFQIIDKFDEIADGVVLFFAKPVLAAEEHVTSQFIVR